jgi:hypothetical protein
MRRHQRGRDQRGHDAAGAAPPRDARVSRPPASRPPHVTSPCRRSRSSVALPHGPSLRIAHVPPSRHPGTQEPGSAFGPYDSLVPGPSLGLCLPLASAPPTAGLWPASSDLGGGVAGIGPGGRRG